MEYSPIALALLNQATDTRLPRDKPGLGATLSDMMLQQARQQSTQADADAKRYALNEERRTQEMLKGMDLSDPALPKKLLSRGEPILAAKVMQMQAKAAPSSTIGKIQADIDAGLITPEVGAAALKKATTIAPVFDPITKQMIYAGGDGFLAPQASIQAPVDYPVGVKGNPAAEQIFDETIAKNAATQFIKEGSEENVVKRQKAETMRETALGLVNDLLADPDAVKSITGTYDSKTPTMLPSSAEAENKIKRLRSILTAENLGLMTGVLSETDLKVIADIAGGGLDQNRTDEGMMEELRTLQKKFGGGATTSSQSDPLGIR